MNFYFIKKKKFPCRGNVRIVDIKDDLNFAHSGNSGTGPVCAKNLIILTTWTSDVQVNSKPRMRPSGRRKFIANLVIIKKFTNLFPESLKKNFFDSPACNSYAVSIAGRSSIIY